MKKLAVTFDFDFIGANGKGKHRDEIAEFKLIFEGLEKELSNFKSTWFIRIDEHIQQYYNNATYFFEKHIDYLDALKSRGHEIGWHFHSFVKEENKYEINFNEKIICKELVELYPVTKKYNLNLIRMGFGYHSNLTMNCINDLGIAYDSSALPDKKALGQNKSDWAETGLEPYFPSKNNYKIAEAKSALNVLEIPISTINGNYLNPTESSQEFFGKLELMTHLNSINTLTHPFELINNAEKLNNFKNNLQKLQNENAYLFTTITNKLA